MISKKDHHDLVRIIQEIRADELPIDKVVERFGGSSVVTTEEALTLFEDARVFEIQPPKDGQWLAILTWWREAHIRGPENKPHVPSARQIRLV